MNSDNTPKGRGRPRAFDSDAALDNALQVFWRRGYEGASLSELTEAMGINRPSLYATYGNKEELFRKALERYIAESVGYVAEAMQAPTAQQVVERFLTQSAEFLTDPANPQGCMIAIGTLACGAESEPVKHLLVAYRNGYEKMLCKRFELAQTQSDLPEGASPALLAKYVATIHQGLSIQAINGATREELLAVVNMALQNWPRPVGQ